MSLYILLSIKTVVSQLLVTIEFVLVLRQLLLNVNPLTINIVFLFTPEMKRSNVLPRANAMKILFVPSEQ